jgi:hypothetical protein
VTAPIVVEALRRPGTLVRSGATRMRELHSIIAVLVIAVNGLAFAAGGVYLWRRREPHRAYAHVLALGQVVLVAQGAVGLILLSEDFRAPDRLHYLYGALALGAILSPWLYAPGEPRRRLAWFVGASLLATGLAIRAYLTGS